VRVHIIGDEVFACEIKSAAADYRYALTQGHDIEIAAYEIPGDVADRCRRLAANLHLEVAGIDLRRTPDGRWCCFEANPSPGFTFYETSPGHPIGAAIVRLLVGCA
jgi:glutathione synthase/RimK-type ligase-like ATP-grasp enzyme